MHARIGLLGALNAGKPREFTESKTTVRKHQQVGNSQHIKVFANADAAETCFEENDPEGGGL
jgi:hypothetical protein